MHGVAAALIALAISQVLSTEAEPPLTLPAALELADGEAPELALAVARVAVSTADVGVAGILPNPKLTLGTTSSTALFSPSLYMALPLFGQRGAVIDAAEAQRRVVVVGVDLTRLDVRLGVTHAWVALWQVQHERLLAQQSAERRARLAEVSRARFAEGAAPRLEVLRAETEALRTRAEADALDALCAAAANRLSALLGRDVGTPEAGELPAAAPALAADEEEALAHHPLLRRAEAALSAGGAVVSREARTRWPLLGVQVGANLFDRAPPPTNDLNVALSFELPLFNGALLTRARTAQGAAAVEVETTRIQLTARFRAARAEYIAALKREQTQLGQLVPAAQEAADLAMEAYRVGGADLNTALSVEQSLSDARLSAMRASAERARAWATLEHAAGSPR